MSNSSVKTVLINKIKIKKEADIGKGGVWGGKTL